MSSIFISYRRSDSVDATGRINDRLRQYYGDDLVFTDVYSIPLGLDFRTYIEEAISKCDVVLAMIGGNWLNAENDEHENRLDDPKDFVRVEIESALQRNIPVIPILLQDTKKPSEDKLPDSLKELSFRNALSIRADPDFQNDIDRLITGLNNHIGDVNSNKVISEHIVNPNSNNSLADSHFDSKRPIGEGIKIRFL